MKAFLEYCYTGGYTFSESGGDARGNAGKEKEKQKEIATPALDFEVYQLADYVLASDVKTYAANMMKERLDNEGTEADRDEALRKVVVDAIVNDFAFKG